MEKIVLTFAEGFDKETAKQIEKRLAQKYPQSQIEIRTDKNLIGGFVAQIGSTVYDYTVDSKLKKAEKHLKG